MPQKKKQKIGGISPAQALLDIIILIVKIPYFIIKGFYNLLHFMADKSKEQKVKHKRQSMRAKYEEFPILKKIKGDFAKWEKSLADKESSIGIILGARGTGKSALGIKILENLHTKSQRHCLAMGFTANQLPSWIKSVKDVESIPKDSYVLIDEGGILFSSRKSMSDANKLLSELILIARHKNISILFISQNSSNLEVNILRQADFLLLKPSSLLQIDFERKKIKDVYAAVQDDFETYKDDKAAVYIYSTEFRGFVQNPLPSFWSKKLSKSFA